MKKLLTLFVLICPLLALAQQTRQITGQVLDRADGTPLVGATVFIAPEETQAKNYNPQGTIVYEQGRFAFKLPVSVKKVVVSYLGYEAQTIDISGKSNFTIYLSATESKMDAVVVTGYQRIEKRKLTSSIANVKMADIARDGVASVDEMLSGSIAGLTSTPTTGAPGGASKVKIRSTVTLNGNTDPLWVLDGMPLEGNDIPSDWSSKENVDNLYNMSIAGLNPADIEDITVLKDAAATAIYGARAANGVIIITTKKGRRNQATRVNVSASLFVTDRPNLDKLNLMNASQKVDLELALAANGRLNYRQNMGGVARILDQADERAALREGGFAALTSETQAAINALTDAGLIARDTGALTGAGLVALEPYRVDNAVILAAGASTRFIPLSLEQPKGLFEVKGEKLIERQIQQLKAAGIDDITVVLGYKKEMFFYLKEKYGVKFIINDAFNIKNNIESLYLARNELKNTYVCVSDSYFVENPFSRFEYQTFYAGLSVSEAVNELYVDTDGDGRIIRMAENRDAGRVLLGHSFWRKEFSDAFIALAEADREVGRYHACFWEWLVKDYLAQLPPMYYKEYTPGTIFEFDYFEELRQFDTQYLSHTHSGIIRNIKLVFRCDEEDIVDFRNVSEGMTNTSFIFKIDGVDYIYRHPGDGTDSIINRRNEKTSLIKAKQLGIDPTYIYADVNEGWKISRFVPQFREPDYGSFADSKKVLSVLRKLHASDVKVDYGMRPWEDALSMQKLLTGKDPNCFAPHEALKAKIGRLYQMTLGDGVGKCFCHGDTYRSNWMLLPDGDVILIDWEYAGFSDPGIDVGYYIVDAMYDFPDAERFIKEYLGSGYDASGRFHYMAYTAIIAYYWFVWALYRESCGADMGQSLENWRAMAEKYADYLLKE